MGRRRRLPSSVQVESGSADWNAPAYHRLSNPHYRWGQKVLDRLSLRGEETVIDAGCGTGRLTADLLERLPRGRVIAVDRSESMLRQAREHLAPEYARRVVFVCGDLAAMPLLGPVDAVFSTATFHWIHDHPRLFERLYLVLKPGAGWSLSAEGGRTWPVWPGERRQSWRSRSMRPSSRDGPTPGSSPIPKRRLGG